MLRLLGGLAGLAGVGFVAFAIYRELGRDEFSDLGYGDFAILLPLVLAYAATNLLLAAAWWWLLKAQGQVIPFASSVRIYGVSQMAKYVPGNVVHLAGRQALAVSSGLAGIAVAKSMAWEMLALAVGALTFSLLLLPLWIDLPVAMVEVAFVISLLAASVAFSRLVSPHFKPVLWLHATFLAVSGLIFWFLVMSLSPESLSHGVHVVAAGFVIAWLIGFVTPGAPAGLGVRELVLLGLFSSSVDAQAILVAVVMSRIVTGLGDLIFYLLTVRKGVDGQ
ncbi:hypothetical protein V6X63_09815 [Spiribacter sp. 221]|uniref:hypothetical protein n=1 Tax=Spiribacter onubensis TaxID=3122420 RepID=UPI00349F903E